MMLKLSSTRRLRNMTPLLTLHHFVHPQWFEVLGGFEKESNIQAYLNWTELAFRCWHCSVVE